LQQPNGEGKRNEPNKMKKACIKKLTHFLNWLQAKGHVVKWETTSETRKDANVFQMIDN